MLIESENRIRLSLFILGFTSITTQIILLREFLSVYNGNELVIGMILANWMLLTGLGSYLGKVFDRFLNKIQFINLSHFLVATLPLIISFSIYYFRNVFYPPGKIINLAEVFFNSFILLMPLCIVYGSFFPNLASALSYQSKSNIINKAYSIEALGSLIGGILFNYVMLAVLKTFFSLTILMMINFAVVILNLYLSGKKYASYALSVITILASILISVSGFDLKVLQFLYPDQEIVYYNNSPYGNIVVTHAENHYNFYDNGNYLYSSDNTIMIEQSVHYAMIQHSNPENILIISGGISGMINEIYKYNIQSVDYVEHNQELIKAGELFSNKVLPETGFTVINEDARFFIRKNKTKKYDVVLINLPDPSTAQFNRFYTFEFFEELKKDLNRNAIVSMSLTSNSNNFDEGSRKINSSIFQTLKFHFQNVIIIPGGLNFYIASDAQLSYSIIEQLELNKINTEYVNRNHLNDERIEHESRLMTDIISERAPVNNDFKPVAYMFQWQYWLRHFDLKYYILITLILFPFIYSFFKLNYINYGVFVTGFSASSVEIIMMIAIQILYGYTYQMLGIIITFFMAGLMTGSVYVANKLSVSIKTFSVLQYLIGVYSIFLALVLYFLQAGLIINLFVEAIFILLIAIIGILTGSQFALATRLRSISISRNASSTYATDLFGASVGAILISAFLIPFFGVIKASLIIAILNFVTGLLILIRKNPIIFK